jgi:Zn-dependent protease with chaperone function
MLFDQPSTVGYSRKLTATKRAAIAGLFRTHPPTKQRVARLEQLAMSRHALVL